VGSSKRRLAAGLGLLALALLVQLAASRRPEAVERYFTRALYPALGGRLACLTAALPFSLAELVGAAVLALVAFRLARWRPRRPFVRRLLERSAGLPLVAAVLYVAFLLLWGLNYQRLPFARSTGLDVRPAAWAELVSLGAVLVERANRAREGLTEDATGVMRLADGRPAALLRTETGFRAAAPRYPLLAGACARPKPLLSSPVFSWLGITGIYSPFTGEANVNLTVPDPELPFSAAHEVAHLRGFAREDEASFVGSLACRLHPDPDFRYSGQLVASIHVLNAVAAVDRGAWQRLDRERSAGTRRDLEALAAWAARYKSPVERFSERVNDAYLRSQGQAQGVLSYGRVVDLLIAEWRAEGAAGPPPSKDPARPD
jgi:uncharacterized protein DUF3810